MTTQHVVITGIGIVSPLGLHAQANPLNEHAGTTAIAPWKAPGEASYCGVAGAIRDFNPKTYLPRKGLRNLNNAINFVRIAANFALEDAGLTFAALEPSRVGIVLGTNQACADHMFRFDRDALEGFVDPLHFPNTGISSPACQISVFEGMYGLTSTFSSGHGASLDALQFSATSLLRGDVDVVITGGVESLCHELQRGDLVESLAWLNGSDTTQLWPGPFQTSTDGHVVGEGSACLILERAGDAHARGAQALARLGGYGTGFDPTAFRNGTPDEDIMAEMITSTLAEADLEPTAVDAVFSGSQGYAAADTAEASALGKIFGKSRLPVCTASAQLGDTHGASGAFLAAQAVAAMQTQQLAGFAPQGNPILDLVHGLRPAHVNHCLLTAFGHMGDRTAMVLHYPH